MPIFLSETKSVEPTAEDRAHEIASTFGLREESPLVAAITAAITEHAAGVEGRLKEAEGERDTAKRLRNEEEKIRIEQEADFLAAVKNLRLQVTAAEARAVKLRGALEKAEWVYDADVALKFCPWCVNWQREGHKPDCARQAALNMQEGAPLRRERGNE